MAGPVAVHRVRCRSRPTSLRLLLLLGCGTGGAVGSNQAVDGKTSNEAERSAEADLQKALRQAAKLDGLLAEREVESSSSVAPTAVGAATTAATTTATTVVVATTTTSELATTTTSALSSTATTGELTSTDAGAPTTIVSTTGATNVSAVIAPSDTEIVLGDNSNSTLDDSKQACSLPTPFPKIFEVDQLTWEAFIDGSTLRGVDGKPLGIVRRRFSLLNTKLELSAIDGKLLAFVNKDWAGNLRFHDCTGLDIVSMPKNWSWMPMRKSTSKVLGSTGEELAVALQQWRAWPPRATVELHDAEGRQLVLVSQERPWIRSSTSVHIVSGSFDSTASTADARTDPRFLVLLAAAHFGVPGARYATLALLILGCCCLTALICCSPCTRSTNSNEARDVEHMTLIEPVEDGYDSGEESKAQCFTACCSGSKPKNHHGLPMAPRN